VFKMENNDLPLHLLSGSQHCHGAASAVSRLTAQPMIGTERPRTGTNDAPARLCVTCGGAVDCRSRQLKPTPQLTTKFKNRPIIDTSNGMSGCLGGAQSMACFGFCVLSPVCCVFTGCIFSMA